MKPFTEIYYDECLKETDSAVLVLIDGDEKWIPSSLIDQDDSVPTAGDGGGAFSVQNWFAENEGLV